MVAHTVGKPDDRLAALVHAARDGVGQIEQPPGNAHGGDGGIAPNAGRPVEHHVGHHVAAVAAQAGEAHHKDIAVVRDIPADEPDREMHLGFAPQVIAELDGKRHRLAERRGRRRAGDAPVKHKDEQRVQRHIEHAAGDLAHHALPAFALGAKALAEHKAADAEGRGDKNKPAIGQRIGHQRPGGAQKPHQALPRRQAHRRDQQPHGQRQKKGGAGDGIGMAVFPGAQHTGHQAGRAGAEPEPQAVEHHHHREHHTHRRRGAGADAPHKKGIGHVIDAHDKGGDHGGDSQRDNQPAHRGVGHFIIFRLFFRRGTGGLHDGASFPCKKCFKL